MSVYVLAGVDLAWNSESNPTAVAIGRLVERRLELVEVVEDLTGEDEVAGTLLMWPDLHGIAIDAPLIINNPLGQRLCERLVGQAYAARKAGCHPTNLELYPDADSVRIARRLAAADFAHAGDPGKPWQLECYPHPALIEWFGLEQRLLYKKGEVEQRRAGQVRLATLLRSLAGSPKLQLFIPRVWQHYFRDDHIHTLRGGRLKHNEDVLDAVICLYTAGLYQLGQGAEVFGNTDEGYIYVPRCRCL